MRWLYHIVRGGDRNERDPAAPSRFAPRGWSAGRIVHTSFRDAVRESVRIHFAGEDPAGLWVLQIDPRRLDVALEMAPTPRGPMPHLHGSVPLDAVRAELPLESIEGCPDRVTGTRFAFVAFSGMTLLDLVGVHDPIARIAGMGFDPTARVEIVSADRNEVWSAEGARLHVERVRPPLADFDVVIVAGGRDTRALAGDGAVAAWLAAYPDNRLIASVCTGALLLGAAGKLRGRRATTHASARAMLGDHGATMVEDRIADEGQVVTAGGVTSGIDLGLHLVRRLVGEDVAAAIAARMEYTR